MYTIIMQQKIQVTMLVYKKTNIYFAIEPQLEGNFFRCVRARANLRALMTQNRAQQGCAMQY